MVLIRICMYLYIVMHTYIHTVNQFTHIHFDACVCISVNVSNTYYTHTYMHLCMYIKSPNLCGVQEYGRNTLMRWSSTYACKRIRICTICVCIHTSKSLRRARMSPEVMVKAPVLALDLCLATSPSTHDFTWLHSSATLERSSACNTYAYMYVCVYVCLHVCVCVCVCMYMYVCM